MNQLLIKYKYDRWLGQYWTEVYAPNTIIIQQTSHSWAYKYIAPNYTAKIKRYESDTLPGALEVLELRREYVRTYVRRQDGIKYRNKALLFWALPFLANVLWLVWGIKSNFRKKSILGNQKVISSQLENGYNEISATGQIEIPEQNNFVARNVMREEQSLIKKLASKAFYWIVTAISAIIAYKFFKYIAMPSVLIIISWFFYNKYLSSEKKLLINVLSFHTGSLMTILISFIALALYKSEASIPFSYMLINMIFLIIGIIWLLFVPSIKAMIYLIVYQSINIIDNLSSVFKGIMSEASISIVIIRLIMICLLFDAIIKFRKLNKIPIENKEVNP